MYGLKQRIKRLEVHAGACNHRLPIILSNPTEEEIRQRETELENCPACRTHEGVRLVIMHYPDLN